MLVPVPLATMATAAFLAVGMALAVATPTELLASEELSGALSERSPTKRRQQGKDKREGKLPSFNYYLDESDPDTVILRRQDGSFVAAFSAGGATKEGIVKAAMEDYRALVWPHEGNPSLTIKMSVPGYHQGLIEVVQRNLRRMPLEPGPPQRDALLRLKPHVEEALGVLDDLDRSGGLSTEERQQREAFKVLRGAIDELE